jgi:LEA14-like dessication related protein
MIKKILIIGGVGLAGFGLYRYFKYQVGKALEYDYRIKNFKYIGIEGDDVKVSATIEITNKSNFNLTINSFDLRFFYKGNKFTDVISKNPTTIEPENTFEVTGYGILNVNDLKQSLPSFISDVATRKPINIEVEGDVKITFIGLNSTINFNKEKFNYSADLIKDIGLAEKYDGLKQKYSKVFSILGIK